MKTFLGRFDYLSLSAGLLIAALATVTVVAISPPPAVDRFDNLASQVEDLRQYATAAIEEEKLKCSAKSAVIAAQYEDMLAQAVRR